MRKVECREVELWGGVTCMHQLMMLYSHVVCLLAWLVYKSRKSCLNIISCLPVGNGIKIKMHEIYIGLYVSVCVCACASACVRVCARVQLCAVLLVAETSTLEPRHAHHNRSATIALFLCCPLLHSPAHAANGEYVKNCHQGIQKLC